MTRTYGFTPRQAYNLFRSLRAEVFPEYGVPSWAIQFSATVEYSPEQPWYGSLASTLYDLSHWAKPAYGIVMDEAFLPYYHEDELRGVILHEFAHVIAGWDADHDEPWVQVCDWLGTVASPSCLLREWESIPHEVFNPCDEWLESLNYQPTFGW